MRFHDKLWLVFTPTRRVHQNLCVWLKKYTTVYMFYWIFKILNSHSFLKSSENSSHLQKHFSLLSRIFTIISNSQSLSRTNTCHSWLNPFNRHSPSTTFLAHKPGCFSFAFIKNGYWSFSLSNGNQKIKNREQIKENHMALALLRFRRNASDNDDIKRGSTTRFSFSFVNSKLCSISRDFSSYLTLPAIGLRLKFTTDMFFIAVTWIFKVKGIWYVNVGTNHETFLNWHEKGKTNFEARVSGRKLLQIGKSNKV